MDKLTPLPQEERSRTERETIDPLKKKREQGGKKNRGSYPQSSPVIHSNLAVIHRKQAGGEAPPGKDWRPAAGFERGYPSGEMIVPLGMTVLLGMTTIPSRMYQST